MNPAPPWVLELSVTAPPAPVDGTIELPYCASLSSVINSPVNRRRPSVLGVVLAGSCIHAPPPTHTHVPPGALMNASACKTTYETLNNNNVTSQSPFGRAAIYSLQQEERANDKNPHSSQNGI